MTIYARLVGGPLNGRSVEVSGKNFGDILELSTSRDTSGVVAIETKAHYQVAPSLEPQKREIVANWINPADRRQHGS